MSRIHLLFLALVGLLLSGTMRSCRAMEDGGIAPSSILACPCPGTSGYWDSYESSSDYLQVCLRTSRPNPDGVLFVGVQDLRLDSATNETAWMVVPVPYVQVTCSENFCALRIDTSLDNGDHSTFPLTLSGVAIMRVNTTNDQDSATATRGVAFSVELHHDDTPCPVHEMATGDDSNAAEIKIGNGIIWVILMMAVLVMVCCYGINARETTIVVADPAWPEEASDSSESTDATFS